MDVVFKHIHRAKNEINRPQQTTTTDPSCGKENNEKRGTDHFPLFWHLTALSRIATKSMKQIVTFEIQGMDTGIVANKQSKSTMCLQCTDPRYSYSSPSALWSAAFPPTRSGWLHTAFYGITCNRIAYTSSFFLLAIVHNTDSNSCISHSPPPSTRV